MRRQMAATSAL